MIFLIPKVLTSSAPFSFDVCPHCFGGVSGCAPEVERWQARDRVGWDATDGRHSIFAGVVMIAGEKSKERTR